MRLAEKAGLCSLSDQWLSVPTEEGEAPQVWCRILLSWEDVCHAEEDRFALRDRAVRLVREHRAEFPSLTAASAALARQVGVGHESVWRRALPLHPDHAAGTPPTESSAPRRRSPV